MSTLLSWGRFPYYKQTAHPNYWRSDLPNQLVKLHKQYATTLAYGNGRSYGDSCLAASNHILTTRHLNRFISVDWSKGIIIAEAGVTLAEILNLAIPQGWFLPVTPGTRYVTLGGALANDVHGKNHHIRGTFGCHVKRFALRRSDCSETLICSKDKNYDLFTATIGGLGLTGIITWLELQLMPIKSSNITTTTIRFNSLNEFFNLADELDSQHEYSVAWIDCLATGSSIGRGVFIVGNHSTDGKLIVDHNQKLRIPFTPPISVINRLSLPILNNYYFYKHKPEKTRKIIAYPPFFYPLDGIQEWNKLYGPKGFQQYQCVIPQQMAISAIHELLKTIAKFKQGSFLAVLKRCGDIPSPGLLSFPLPGVSLALDFPQTSRNQLLFSHLDAIVREAKGRLYPAKDAHMTAINFRQFYPAWEKIEALRDPVLLSHFWKRVTT